MSRATPAAAIQAACTICGTTWPRPKVRPTAAQVLARGIAALVLRERLHLSYPEIARELNLAGAGGAQHVHAAARAWPLCRELADRCAAATDPRGRPAPTPAALPAPTADLLQACRMLCGRLAAHELLGQTDGCGRLDQEAYDRGRMAIALAEHALTAIGRGPAPPPRPRQAPPPRKA